MADATRAFSYKCPNCGADLPFSAENQNFTCRYCMSAYSEEEMAQIAAKKAERLAAFEKEQAALTEQFEKETGVYRCETCGAEIMADDNTAATFCFYCDNPVILKGRVTGQYRPSMVLPFQVSREQAVEEFRKFCKKKWFLPSDFSSSAQEEKIVGLYVPFWVTDCDVSAEMDAIGRKVRSWTAGDYRYTETQEFALVRQAQIVLEGLPADGASHVDDELMEALEPFDYSKAKPFAMQYLSGFLAEKYDVDTAGVFPRIQKRAVQASDQLVRASMSGYSSISVTRADVKVQKTDWKYMLLPVWFLSYRYRDKVYEFAVNGQSGVFAGVPPLCRKKHLLATIGIGLAAAIIAGLVVMLV